MPPRSLSLSEHQSLKKFAGFAFSFIIVSLLMLGSLVLLEYREIVRLDEESIKINKLSSQIIYLDEVLTMSAKMAAATADPFWQIRYDKHVLSLEKAIAELKKTGADEFQYFAEKTQKANYILVYLEQQAFEKITQGYPQLAAELISGKDYLENKKLYQEGIFELQQQLDLKIQKDLHNAQQFIFLASLLTLLSTPLVIFIWMRFIALIESYKDAREKIEADLHLIVERSQAATRAKSEFLANMSHEIRTPIHVVIGMSRLALQTDLTARQQDYIAKTKQAAEGLLRIVNDILDSSKIEAGKLVIESIEFDLSQVISNLSNLLGFKALEKNLELMMQIDPKLPNRLVGDPLRLEQILTNLVTNAIKFTEAYGEVSLQVKVKSISETHVTIHFIVHDSGIGMTEEQLRRLFQAFSQADTSTTRQFGGTGLGLSISKNLVQQMGGKIWADSQLGKGSNFHFELRFPIAEQSALIESIASSAGQLQPLSRIAQPKTQQKTAQQLSWSGIDLLVVEDNPANQQIASEILSEKGFNVEIAGNGREAIEKLQQKTFAGILMDVQMPIMDGYQATREIRLLDAYKNLPIIAMTANAMPSDVADAKAAGMNDHIAKPIDFDSLFRTLEKWIAPVAKKLSVNALVDINEDLLQLPDLVAIDLHESALSERPSLYLRMLRMFFDKYVDHQAFIRQLTDNRDQAESVRLVHSLKGLSATLGAVKLSEVAGRLEQSLAAGDEASPGIAELAAQLQPLIADLADFFADAANDLDD